jgi:outer membrane protein TolC
MRQMQAASTVSVMQSRLIHFDAKPCRLQRMGMVGNRLLGLALPLALMACAQMPDQAAMDETSQKRAALQLQANEQTTGLSTQALAKLDKPDWADLVSHALALHLPLKIKEVDQWLAMDQAQQAWLQNLPSYTVTRTQIRRNVDDSTVSGSNAGSRRVINSQEWSWDALGAGAVWLRSQASSQRSAASVLAVQAAAQMILLECLDTLHEAKLAASIEPALAQSLAEVERALALTKRLEPLHLQDPLTVLSWRESLLELQRQLRAEQVRGQMARMALAHLLRLSDPKALPAQWDAPTVIDGTVLNQTLIQPWQSRVRHALENNRDLRQSDLELQALKLEKIAAWMGALPGVRLSYSRDRDTSTALTHNRWEEWGATGSFHFLSLLGAWQQASMAEHNREREALRQHLLGYAVVEQIRQGYVLLAAARDRLDDAAGLEYSKARQHDIRQTRLLFAESDEIERARANGQWVLAKAGLLRSQQDVQRQWLQLAQVSGRDPLPIAFLSQGGRIDAQSLRQNWSLMLGSMVQNPSKEGL